MLKEFVFGLMILSLVRLQDVSEDDEYLNEDDEIGEEEEEESEPEILYNVKDLDASLEMFPLVFLYITKDNCQFCLKFDKIFEHVFNQIQQDQTGNSNKTLQKSSS